MIKRKENQHHLFGHSLNFYECYMNQAIAVSVDTLFKSCQHRCPVSTVPYHTQSLKPNNGQLLPSHNIFINKVTNLILLKVDSKCNFSIVYYRVRGITVA